MTVDVAIRIRRAIHLSDLILLKRIIKNNPQHLQSPDFENNGNTSLHLAAQLGLLEIAVCPNPTSAPNIPSPPSAHLPTPPI